MKKILFVILIIIAKVVSPVNAQISSQLKSDYTYFVYYLDNENYDKAYDLLRDVCNTKEDYLPYTDFVEKGNDLFNILMVKAKSQSNKELLKQYKDEFEKFKLKSAELTSENARLNYEAKIYNTINSQIEVLGKEHFESDVIYDLYINKIVPFYKRKIKKEKEGVDYFNDVIENAKIKIKEIEQLKIELAEIENTTLQIPLDKGEFEKLDAYNARKDKFNKEKKLREKTIAKLNSQIKYQNEYELQIVGGGNTKDRCISNIASYRNKLLHEAVPERLNLNITYTNYDSEKEIFNLKIGRDRYWVKVPIDIAPELKNSINQISLYHYKEYHLSSLLHNDRYLVVFNNNIYNLHGFTINKSGTVFETIKIGPYSLLAFDLHLLNDANSEDERIITSNKLIDGWKIPLIEDWENIFKEINWIDETGKLISYIDISEFNVTLHETFLCRNFKSDYVNHYTVKVFKEDGLYVPRTRDPFRTIRLRLIKKN